MWVYLASATKSKTRFDQARTEAFLTMTTWTVYIVRCADDTLYTGIARDAARRVEEHNSNDLLAARYTRTRRPVALVYEDVVATRSDALKHEYRIKQMTRKEKEKLIMKP